MHSFLWRQNPGGFQGLILALLASKGNLLVNPSPAYQSRVCEGFIQVTWQLLPSPRIGLVTGEERNYTLKPLG